jgi:hypothetical protein
MYFGIRLKGRRVERKKGSERWIEDLAEYIRTCINPTIELKIDVDRIGRPCLSVPLHPAAEPILISTSTGERVSLRARTVDVGPGYHIAVCNFIKSISIDRGISWDVPSPDNGTGDDTGYLYMSDESVLIKHHLDWLTARCSFFASAELSNSSQRCVPRPGAKSDEGSIKTIFEIPDDVTSFVSGPLGFRNKQWMNSFLQHPEKAGDYFPWWHNNMAGFIFGCAVLNMWCEVAWRTPIDEEEAHKLWLISRDLESAYELNPQLPFPWSAWHELNELIANSEEPLKYRELVKKNASSLPATFVGYRRGHIRLGFGGWTVRVPGDFKEPRLDNGILEIRAAEEKTRIVRMSVPRKFSPGRGGQELTAAELVRNLVRPEPVDGQIIELQGSDDRVGKAWWEATFSEGKHLLWLKSIVAIGSQAVLVSIFVEDEADKQWAVETWKSLMPDANLNMVNFETFTPPSREATAELAFPRSSSGQLAAL